MPVKDMIELSEGQLYIQDLTEPIKVYDGELEIETDYAEDAEPYIKFSQDPIELTFDNSEFAKGWTFVECKECGYQFPVTEFYALLCGTTGWTCPKCQMNKLIEDYRKRSKE